MKLIGQIVSGGFGELLVRKKSGEDLEVGELLVAESDGAKQLLQVFDLEYGSQISGEARELLSGMKLEGHGEGTAILEEELRNYVLAKVKGLVTVKNGKPHSVKSLPSLFSTLRRVEEGDLSFLDSPNKPLFLGYVRSGSKAFPHPVIVDGEKVLSHHILIPASTGRGKSLDGEEKVLIRDGKRMHMKKIAKLVESRLTGGKSEVKGKGKLEVFSINPRTLETSWKKVTAFVRHDAPKEMFKVKTASGRECLMTGDHCVYALRNGEYELIETKRLKEGDCLAQPQEIKFNSRGKEFEWPNATGTKIINGEITLTSGRGKRVAQRTAATRILMRLLGYYVSEGSISGEMVRISSKNPVVREDVRKAAKELGLKTFTTKKKNENADEVISSRVLGKVMSEACGRGAKNKHTPLFLLSLKKELISEFLKAYFEGDGGIEVSKQNLRVTACTKSRRLASELTYALSFFGITARIRQKNVKNYGDFQVITISGREEVKKFIESIGFTTKKIPNMNYEANTNIDLLPVPAGNLRLIRKALRLEQGELAFAVGCSQSVLSTYEAGKRKPSRKTLKRMVIVFEKRLQRIIQNKGIETLEKAVKEAKTGIKISIQKQNISIRQAAERAKFNISPRASENKVHRLSKQFNSYAFFTVSAALKNEENEFNEKNLKNALRDACAILNYSSPGLPVENKNNYYANNIDGLKAPSFLKLAKQVVNIKKKAVDCQARLRQISALTNVRWDAVKKVEKIKYNKKSVYDLTVAGNHTFYAGNGGMFVHNSNLVKVMLWSLLDSNYCGVLVLDAHGEYQKALSPHEKARENLVSYSTKAENGAVSLRINKRLVKPWHLKGVVRLSEAQEEAIYTAYREKGDGWIDSCLAGEELPGVQEGTICVLQRKMKLLLKEGLFVDSGSETIVDDAVAHLQGGRKVIIDTSTLGGETELLVASIFANAAFNKARSSSKGKQISIVLEEAPRVLSEAAGSNVFSTIAREGRKFGVGLIAITQLASLIPKEVLANLNTKIILGNEMKSEREAIIGSAAQDLSNDFKAIGALDKGEAIVSSVFTACAVPIKVPLFEDYAESKAKAAKKEFVL